jgi:hypothetical protein
MSDEQQTGWHAEERHGKWVVQALDHEVIVPPALASVLNHSDSDFSPLQAVGGFYASCFNASAMTISIMHGFAVGEKHFAGQLASLPAVTGDFRGERLLRDRLDTGDSPNLVHALKAPVSRIVGLSEVLLASSDIAGENRRLVQYIDQSASKLRELIGMVLEEPRSTSDSVPSSSAFSHTVSQFMKLHSARPGDVHAVRVDGTHSGVEHLRFFGMPPAARLFTGAKGLLSAPLGLAALHDALHAEVFVFSANGEALDLCVCSAEMVAGS